MSGRPRSISGQSRAVSPGRAAATASYTAGLTRIDVSCAPVRHASQIRVQALSMTTDSHITQPGFHSRQELQSAANPSARTLGGVNLDDLPRAEFAFPGPLRDKLVAAILSGVKTSTSGLVLEYERANEPLPTVGQLQAVVD